MKSLSIVPIACFLLFSATCLQAVEPLRQFGFAKIDITPTDSLRLSGYGSRDKPSEGIDERLFTRAMALRETDGSTHLLVAIDTIGVSGVMTKQLQEKIEKKHGIPRHRFVICCSDSHTSPHLDLGLDNLFTVPLSKDEQQKTHAYTETLRQHVLTVVDQAIADLAPGRMFYAEGSARFARNRRVIVDGVWKGFGENPNGPVDHSLPMLKIIDESATAITLARADGKKTTVLRLEIDEIASGLSFMPEGLEKDLTLQDLADLLTFVQGESQQRETPP